MEARVALKISITMCEWPGQLYTGTPNYLIKDVDYKWLQNGLEIDCKQTRRKIRIRSQTVMRFGLITQQCQFWDIGSLLRVDQFLEAPFMMSHELKTNVFYIPRSKIGLWTDELFEITANSISAPIYRIICIIIYNCRFPATMSIVYEYDGERKQCLNYICLTQWYGLDKISRNITPSRSQSRMLIYSCGIQTATPQWNFIDNNEWTAKDFFICNRK